MLEKPWRAGSGNFPSSVKQQSYIPGRELSAWISAGCPRSGSARPSGAGCTTARNAWCQLGFALTILCLVSMRVLQHEKHSRKEVAVSPEMITDLVVKNISYSLKTEPPSRHYAIRTIAPLNYYFPLKDIVIIGGEVAEGAVQLTIVSESRGQKHLFICYINQINLVKFTNTGRKAMRSVMWPCPKTGSTVSIEAALPREAKDVMWLQVFIWLLSFPVLHILNLLQALLKAYTGEELPAQRDSG